MKWMNDPASFKRNGDEFIVQSKPKTDFWRKTYYGYITDNGHFFHLQATGDFVFEARINGQYAAGIMCAAPKAAASTPPSTTSNWSNPSRSPLTNIWPKVLQRCGFAVQFAHF